MESTYKELKNNNKKTKQIS